MENKKANIFTKLKKLFSSEVVIRQVDGKIKVIDVNNHQSFNDLTTNYLKQGFIGLHSSLSKAVYDDSSVMSVQRSMLFRDYELMDDDPILASALNIVSSECVSKNEFGDIITVNCDNSNVKSTLENLFYDIMNLEFNLRPWIRSCLKYGDYFLKLELAENYGVVNVVPVSAYEMKRIEGFDERNVTSVKFIHEAPFRHADEYESYEVAHFRILSDTSFLPYGKSFMEPARRIYKQLALLEDAMLIHRIMRAPEKRVFKIDTGTIPPSEIDNYMQKAINKIKKIPFIDQNTGDYNLKYNMMNITEDFYIPVRGSDSGAGIETLNGLTYTAIEDIEYLRDKMLSALGVPKPFLGYGEAVSGKAQMAGLDIRFSKTIEFIQSVFLSELYKVAIIHLYMQGFTTEDLSSFKLSLTCPSSILEQEKISIWQEKTSLARDMIEINLFSSDWISKNIFNMTESDIAEQRRLILDDKKRKFRYDQLENEGNDPIKTNQSFGTSHDLALLQKGITNSSKPLDFGSNNFKYNYDNLSDEKLGVDNSKLEKIDAVDTTIPNPHPLNKQHYGQDSHVIGRDPLGGKDYINTVNNMRFKESRSYGTLIDLLKKKKSKNIIKESLSGMPENEENVVDNSILNENNILNL